MAVGQEPGRALTPRKAIPCSGAAGGCEGPDPALPMAGAVLGLAALSPFLASSAGFSALGCRGPGCTEPHVGLGRASPCPSLLREAEQHAAACRSAREARGKHTPGWQPGQFQGCRSLIIL